MTRVLGLRRRSLTGGILIGVLGVGAALAAVASGRSTPRLPACRHFSVHVIQRDTTRTVGVVPQLHFAYAIPPDHCFFVGRATGHYETGVSISLQPGTAARFALLKKTLLDHAHSLKGKVYTVSSGNPAIFEYIEFDLPYGLPACPPGQTMPGNGPPTCRGEAASESLEAWGYGRLNGIQAIVMAQVGGELSDVRSNAAEKLTKSVFSGKLR